MVGMPYKPDIKKAKELNRDKDVDIILDKYKKFYKSTIPNPLNESSVELKNRESEHGNATAAINERYHYHHSLKRGENTINTHLCRLLLRFIVKCKKNKVRYTNREFAKEFVLYIYNIETFLYIYIPMSYILM